MRNDPMSLHSFKSILPRFRGTQTDLVDWIVDKHYQSMELAQLADRDRLKNVLKRFCVSEKQIGNS